MNQIGACVLSRVLLALAEESENEVALLVWFKGRRHDDVVAGRQAVSVTDFSEISECRGSRRRSVSLEELIVEGTRVTWRSLYGLRNNISRSARVKNIGQELML